MMGWASKERERGVARIATLDFAAQVRRDQVLRVWESGTHMGDFGSVQRGDTITVALNGRNRVDYTVNGQVRYTSQRAPAFPLYLKLAASRRGPCAEQVQWILESRMPADIMPTCTERCRDLPRSFESKVKERNELRVRLSRMSAELEIEMKKIRALRREMGLQPQAENLEVESELDLPYVADMLDATTWSSGCSECFWSMEISESLTREMIYLLDQLKQVQLTLLLTRRAGDALREVAQKVLANLSYES